MKKLCKKCVGCYLPQGLLQSVFATVLFLIIKNGKENRDDKIMYQRILGVKLLINMKN